MIIFFIVVQGLDEKPSQNNVFCLYLKTNEIESFKVKWFSVPRQIRNGKEGRKACLVYV